jgi:hypothetical protein
LVLFSSKNNQLPLFLERIDISFDDTIIIS